MSSAEKSLVIAVVGATGAVGREFFSILKQRKYCLAGIPVERVLAFASPRSEGVKIPLEGHSKFAVEPVGERSIEPVGERSKEEVVCQVLKPGCFQGVDYVFFDASDAISKEWVPEAARNGAWVVDSSGYFRMDPEITLGVPEVNGEAIDAQIARAHHSPHEKSRIFAGPNCSTVQLVVALKPIANRWGLKRVVMSSYQSVSGAGLLASTELKEQTAEKLGFGKAPQEKPIFPHPIAFNCIPQIGSFVESGEDAGYTSEESKIMAESRKILELPQLKISATAIRVPTLSSHSESVNIETERDFEISEIRAALADHPGIRVIDNPAQKQYPLNTLASGGDTVDVGRIRRDPSVEKGLNLWIVSDNLRKGAALNAVQIAERMIRCQNHKG